MFKCVDLYGIYVGPSTASGRESQGSITMSWGDTLQIYKNILN